MSIPLRNGDCIDLISAVDAAPHRTAFKKASNLTGGSNPDGSGKERLCWTDVPGSSSQTTWSSSPRASSSMEESVTRCWLGGCTDAGRLVERLLWLMSMTV